MDDGHRLASYDTLLQAAVLIVGEDDEMFMTRSLNFMPKTIEQRI